MKDSTFFLIIAPIALVLAALVVLFVLPACANHITITP